uniref:G-protein coupled receptors family 1 profile domain-containing protein n=1 Tax=Chelonoidis abingdonii TaxID=106734 RepID=A0A8C0G1F8_CHEAB
AWDGPANCWSLGASPRLFLVVLLIIAIILGNVVSLLVFLQARQFRTSQGYLKVSLALADLAVGLIVVCSIPSLPCFVTGPIFAGCTFVSITTIFLLSVERSVAVLKPLHKRAVITKRQTVWLILLSWSMSFLLAVVPMISSPDITLQYNPCSKMCTYAFRAGRLLPGTPWNIMLLFPAFDFSLLGGTFVINFITFTTIRLYCKARGWLGSEAQHNSRLSFSDITAAKTIGILTFAFSWVLLAVTPTPVGSDPTLMVQSVNLAISDPKGESTKHHFPVDGKKPQRWRDTGVQVTLVHLKRNIPDRLLTLQGIIGSPFQIPMAQI